MKIKINKSNGHVFLPDKYLSRENDNLIQTLDFEFADENLIGQGQLDFKMPSGISGYIDLEYNDGIYSTPIYNAIAKEGELELQFLVFLSARFIKTKDTSIVQGHTYYIKVNNEYEVVVNPVEEELANYYVESVPLYHSKKFSLTVDPSINATLEANEEYPTKIALINAKLVEVNQALEDIDTAIKETNNLNLDVSKEGKVATVTLTKKDAATKVVTLSDGTSLMFNWNGTKLGIKTDEEAEYTYVDLQGIQGETGPMGAPFTIKKTYSSVAEMNADFNNMQLGDYVMIASTVEIEDNAKLYTRGEEQWIFISDFSGSQGIKGETGATPNIQIGSVISGNAPSVTRTGTNENPILNFVLEKGDKGDTGSRGETGATGNGIASIVKTSTSGLVDTYTITFTDNTTTTFEVTNGEDGEVTQAQLDKTNKQVELAKMVYNALPKVTGTGTEITLNNTAETPIKLELKPSELSQETTTGKNLFDISKVISDWNNSTNIGLKNNGDGTITIATPSTSPNVVSDAPRKLQDYCPNLQVGDIVYLNVTSTGSNKFIYLTTSANSWVFGTQRTITQNDLDSTVYWYASGKSTTATLSNIMVSTENTDYEPYTGGIPSPNPDYPQEIHTITGDNEIKIENKNLFDTELELGTINDNTGVPSPSTTTIRTKDFIKVTPNSDYKLSVEGEGYNIVFYRYDKNQNFIGTKTVAKTTYLTTTENTYYIKFKPYTATTDTTLKIMLNKGQTIETYEEHKEQVFSIPLGNLEYCKMGNYSDEFIYNTTDTNLELNKWYLKKNIGKVVLDEATALYTYNNMLGVNFINAIPTKDTRATGMCNRSSKVGKYYSQNSIWVGATDRYIYWIGILDVLGLTTLEQFNNWLSNHNTIVYYALTTPTYTPLSDTLQEVLTNLYNYAYSYQNQTNISQVNDDLSITMNAEAVRDMSGIFELIGNQGD